MHTALKSVCVATLAGACLAASAASAGPAVPAAADGAVTIEVPPTRSVPMPGASLTGGPALASDGTMFVMRDPELHVYSPGSTANPKVITGLNTAWYSTPSYDPERGLAVAALLSPTAVAVLDPAQPAGPAVFTRTISGPSTHVDDVVSVSWAPDGSLWAVDLVVDGGDGVELLRFAPGADGDVAPDRVITGSATGLADVKGYAGIAVDTLPDGSAVVGAMGVHPGVLVFGPELDGNVAPVRRLTPSAPGTNFAQLGVAADSRGRIYVAMGELAGREWGELAVYPAGASGAAAPVLRLTGPATGLHTIAFPSLAPDDGLVLADTVVVGGQATSVRMLEFDPLPDTPSGPRSLKATKRGRSVTFRWRPPADTGGAPITGYRLVITKGARTVRTEALPAGAGRYAIKTRRLPKGRLKVRVTAMNAAGPGPAAVRSFRR